MAIIAVVIFTTDIGTNIGDSGITLKSSFYKTDVPYSSITKIELRDDITLGSRTNGIATFTISGGIFTNKEFGRYNLYSYNKVKNYVVIYSGNVVTVFNLKTPEGTKAAYETLRSKTGL